MTNINEIPKGDSVRAVHDGKTVLQFFRSSGVTKTIHNVISGTEPVVRAEIAKLGLAFPDSADLTKKPIPPTTKPK